MIKFFTDVFKEPWASQVEGDAIHALNGNNIIWLDLDEHSHPCIINIVQECSKYIDLSKAVGFELWMNSKDTATKESMSDWHVDSDEHGDEGIDRPRAFPICSVVYYSKVELLEGGDLVFRDTDHRIKPERNSLALFSPGVEHRVEPFIGIRTSIAVNFWNHKLEKYNGK